jgi:hypothetical protein
LDARSAADDNPRRIEGASMKEYSKDLLIAEFESAWQQLFNFDTRRGMFFSCFNVVFFIVLTFTASVWAKGTQSLFTAIALSSTFVLLAFMARAIKGVLESERAANVRYRMKINLIREMFLAEDEDPAIQKYLEQKDLGIKTFSGEGNEIGKVGGTLKHVYFMLHLQQGALVVLAVLVWVAFCISSRAA